MRQMEKKITAMRKYLQPMAALLKNRRLNSARTGKGKKVIQKNDYRIVRILFIRLRTFIFF